MTFPWHAALAALLALTTLPAPAAESASASFLTGNELHARLVDWKREESKDIITAALGYGFVMGVADAIHGYNEPRTGFCYRRPEKVTTGEIVNAVFSYLERHPEKRNLSAWSLTAGGLSEAYPCR